MRVKYDQEVDVLTIRFSDTPAMALTWRFIVIEPAYATAYSKDFGFSICFDAFKISMPTIFPVLS